MASPPNAKRWKRIGAFLLLTAGLSAIAEVALIREGTLTSNTWLVLGLMWCPGVAALLTQLYSFGSIRGLGWKLPQVRYALLAYFLPVAYALPVYALVWSAGWATITSQESMQTMARQLGITSSGLGVFAVHAFLVGGMGVLLAMVFALGEEIGWRGFLLPELTKVMSFRSAALFSGVIWALWHFPLLIWTDYNQGVPAWFALPCFTTMVFGIGTAMAWLRLKSASLWPAVILHASHNAWIQQFFTPITVDTSIAKYVIDEFGIGMALSCAVVGIIFYRRGKQLPPAEIAANG